MVSSKITTILGLAALASAAPFTEKRTVTSLNQAAFAQAQKRDATAVRAFSSIEIHSSDGRCLFVDELSGDFRANLNPIELAACDGSTGQKWDIISRGKHNNRNGTMLVVNTLTQACMNFDPRRAAGDQVIMFSCGGRADGSGEVTNSQLFSFGGQHGPDSFEPENAPGTCFTISGEKLDEADCVDGEASQLFVLGDLPQRPGTSSSGGSKDVDHGSSGKGSSSSGSSKGSSGSSSSDKGSSSSKSGSKGSYNHDSHHEGSSGSEGSHNHGSYHKGSSGGKESYNHGSYHKGSSVEATSTKAASYYNAPPPPPPAYVSPPEVSEPAKAEPAKAIYNTAPACTPKVVTLTVPAGSPMPTQKY